VTENRPACNPSQHITDTRNMRRIQRSEWCSGLHRTACPSPIPTFSGSKALTSSEMNGGAMVRYTFCSFWAALPSPTDTMGVGQEGGSGRPLSGL